MNPVLAARLANQSLSSASTSGAADLVAHLGGVQSQDFPGALWALGVRVGGVSRANLQMAFARGEFLRTHVLRPTWHFVAPADIRWMLMLSGPRVKASIASRARSLELTAEVLSTAQAAITRALEGGNSLTRADVGQVLLATGLCLDDPGRLTHILLHAELDALICSGPPRGAQQTYMLLEERVAPASPLTRDEALAELTWRYFSSHGPAVVQDCVWWSGLTVGDVKRGLELNSGRLTYQILDGQAYWSGMQTSSPKGSARVLLLPNFDEYTVAYRLRDLYYDRERNYTGNARLDVPFRDVIVVNGQVAGWWKRGSTGGVEPHWSIDPTPAARTGLEKAAQAYAAFVAPLT